MWHNHHHASCKSFKYSLLRNPVTLVGDVITSDVVSLKSDVVPLKSDAVSLRSDAVKSGDAASSKIDVRQKRRGGSEMDDSSKVVRSSRLILGGRWQVKM